MGRPARSGTARPTRGVRTQRTRLRTHGGRALSRLIAIHQPTFLPWLGWWDKLARADVLVLLDDVQYPKKGGSWMNRARILAGGEPAWITVPLDRSFHGIRQVREMRIDVTKPWREGIVSRIAAGYSRAAHRDEVLPVVEELLSTSADRIAELNERAIRRLAPELGLDASKLVRQSDLGVTGSATELIVSLCRAVNGDAYLTGDGANGYLELRPFEDAGIELLYQRFVPPRYPQPAAEYVAGLSVVDLLMNCGWAGARALLVPSPQASV